MSYTDIEYKLEQYARWIRTGREQLYYPNCTAFAAVIPPVIPDDAVADISDDEGKYIEKALLSLKASNRDAHKAIEARFVFGIYDDFRVGKLFEIGGKAKVWSLRQQGYSFLDGWMSAHA
ncbi:MAG: antiterminator Q family protein [Cardiobacteriaceae bacterium]|nr:antiterminator Q family protein [Cardiobacteriaceae bacterium]